MSLDGGYSSRKNRKLIFNCGMTPNIPENKRNRKKTKRGRKQIFSKKIFKERFRTIERIFAWEDKFKRLLLRFEIKSEHHYAMKTIAYTKCLIGTKLPAHARTWLYRITVVE